MRLGVKDCSGRGTLFPSSTMTVVRYPRAASACLQSMLCEPKRPGFARPDMGMPIDNGPAIVTLITESYF